MQVQLFKKNGTYTDAETGKEKRFVNFYLKCGDALVPVQVCYFPNPKCDNKDPQYVGRREILSAFAATLPDKHDNSNSMHSTQSNAGNTPPHDLTPVDDTDTALSSF